MIALDAIRDALATRRPRLLAAGDRREAGVALVLVEGGSELEVLLIERARHENDPWSGHMALPGGRREALDPSVAAAAERETREELGVALSSANRLGRIDDIEGRHSGRPAGMIVSCFVYAISQPVNLSPNYEVHDVVWTPMSALLDPRRTVVDFYRPDRREAYAGIRVSDKQDQIVWGMTYRFLANFFAAVGRPLPFTSESARSE